MFTRLTASFTAFIDWLANSRIGRLLRLDDRSVEEERQRNEDRSVNSLVNRDFKFEQLKELFQFDDSKEIKEIDVLKGILRNTDIIARILFEAHRIEARAVQIQGLAQESEHIEVKDLIISSSGQVYETAPTDSILAIQNGSVSLNPSNPVSSVSDRFASAGDSSQGSSNSNTTNVYSSSTNIDFGGLSPFSEFCPVGV